VTFAYKDYRQGGREKELTLSGEEFTRRFVQHVLPRGFVRVRHSGLLANRVRAEKLALCRRLLRVEALTVAVAVLAESSPRCCVVCGEGWMEVVRLLPRAEGTCVEALVGEDSS